MQTKQDLISYFKSMGLHEGSIVCVQASDDAFVSLLGSQQSCIEALMEVVTKSGCIMVPTFDTTSLDPSCLEGINYEDWKLIRNNLPGYRTKLSGCNTLGMQFLRNAKVRRSKHPVYSFAYWGQFDSDWLTSCLDFPLAIPEETTNLLIGMDAFESLMVYTVARKKNVGTWFVERAKVGGVSSSVFETFMNLRIEKKEQDLCLQACSIKSDIWNDVSYTFLSLDNSLEK